MSLPGIGSIFHPSDFSEASEVAFVHALKLTLAARAHLSVLHVTPELDVDWVDFPGVRATLERWGIIPPGSPKRAVVQLGIEVTKVIATSRRPVQACLKHLAEYPADLIVLAIHQYEGRMRWLEQRVAEPIARRAGTITLFIPHGVRGFVSSEDGSLSLRKILIPIAHNPSARPALEAVSRMVRALELPSGDVTLLHVGPSSDAPMLSTPEDSGWNWTHSAREGEPVEAILQTAAAIGADLIVMTTEGPHGFLDALRGSTSEQVLRRSRCPVVSLPAEAVSVA